MVDAGGLRLAVARIIPMNRVCLFLLSLGVSLAFWPGAPGAAIVPKFALLYVVLPAALFWLRPRMSLPGFIGLLFLAWAAVSFAWTTSQLDAVDELAKIVLVIGLAFVIGQESESLAPAYWGLGLGLTASSLVSIAQEFGYQPVVTGLFRMPPGLWVNPNTQAEIAIPVLVAVLATALRGVPHPPAHEARAARPSSHRNRTRLYLLALGIVPAAFIPHARGPLLGLGAATLLWCWSRWRAAAILAVVPVGLVVGTGAIEKWSDAGSLDEHMAIWRDTIDGLTWWGHGIGSYYTTYPVAATREDTAKARPDHAHSDPLEVAFELGAPGVALVLVLVSLCVYRARERERLALVALLAAAATGFPLHNAGTGYLFGLLAGHAAAGGHRLRGAQLPGGVALFPRFPGKGPVRRAA